MKYNDLSGGNYIVGMREVFDGVKAGNICVSRFGDREVYWWPEATVYSKTNSDGSSMAGIDQTLKSQCG